MRECKHCNREVKQPRGYVCNLCANNLRKYGITTPEREDLLLSQNGKCKTCESSIHFSEMKHSAIGKHAAVVDHDHATGKVRGILCGDCNVSLGKVGERIETLRSMIKYLEEQ